MATDRLTKDKLAPFGLGRSKLAKMLDEHERLHAESRAAGERFREARMAHQANPRDLARRAQEAAEAGETVDLVEDATSADAALRAAQATAAGVEQARTAAVAKIGAHLRSDEGEEVRAKVDAVLKERRAKALEAIEAAVAAVDALAEAIAVADAVAARPAGATPSLSLVPANRHPLHRAVGELAAQVAAAGPKAPKVPADDAVVGMSYAGVR